MLAKMYLFNFIFMGPKKTKKLTKKNVKQEITKAIKKVATAGLKEIKNQRPRATGLWWHPIKIEITPNLIYPVSYDVGRWCLDRDFPLPKNEEEENKIMWLYDYQMFILNSRWSEFWSDIKDIMTWGRARLFYLWFFIGLIWWVIFYYEFFA